MNTIVRPYADTEIAAQMLVDALLGARDCILFSLLTNSSCPLFDKDSETIVVNRDEVEFRYSLSNRYLLPAIARWMESLSTRIEPRGRGFILAALVPNEQPTLERGAYSVSLKHVDLF